EEALAELDDAPAVHREEVVVEEDVPDAEALETPADRDHAVDAVEAPAPPRRRAVAERARERAAARRDDARDRRRAIVEHVRLEMEREAGDEVPRGIRQRIELVAVEERRGGIHADDIAVAIDEPGDVAPVRPRDELR